MTATSAGPVNGRPLVLLTAEDVAALRAVRGRGDVLPYRLDHLADLGWKVTAYDPTSVRRFRVRRRLAALLDRFLPPAGPVLAALPQLWSHQGSTALAVFESQGHFLALCRALFPPLRRRSGLVIVSCWLAQLLPTMPWPRRAVLRLAYRGVDGVLFFSRNQQEVFERHLGVPSERLARVPFGVDVAEFPRAGFEETEDYLLAVGRDRGRDWSTTFAAVDGLSIRVKVLCRPAELRGLSVPQNVEVLGYVPRAQYQALLRASMGVLVLTEERAYPTGQSVLLESMAAGKCCVVTGTVAMSEYVAPNETALVVPPGDAAAARDRVVSMLTDTDVRRRIGEAAATAVRRDYSASEMCARISDVLISRQSQNGR